jgi:hypothetical protein
MTGISKNYFKNINGNMPISSNAQIAEEVSYMQTLSSFVNEGIEIGFPVFNEGPVTYKPTPNKAQFG